MAEHYLDASLTHNFWDNSHPPRLVIDPGDTIVFECRDPSDGQVTPATTVADLAGHDPSRIHPLTGPVYIRSAQPGDALAVEILAMHHHGWGFTLIVPNAALLGDEFRADYIHQWRIEGRDCWFKEGTGICVPYEPFCGVMGVAPAESGRHGTIPPGVHGGNMDIRDLVPGARLTLPVCVPGALFSVGDCHCAQGDGEVSGTAIEAPMSVALRFNLQRAANLAEPQMVAPPPSRRRSERGYFVTTAHGPDLLGGARQATRYMVDHLEGYYGLTRQEAYVLCSAAVDLRISQVVNVPNFTVSAYLPLAIFPS
jgi:acetamidase/formamidase